MCTSSSEAIPPLEAPEPIRPSSSQTANNGLLASGETSLPVDSECTTPSPAYATRNGRSAADGNWSGNENGNNGGIDQYEEEEERYLPAYELVDGDLERAGRGKRPAPGDNVNDSSVGKNKFGERNEADVDEMKLEGNL